jgi:hypothetical protein
MKTVRRDGCGNVVTRCPTCTAVVGSRAMTRQCKRDAWWPGGRCPRHFDPKWTIGDWLAGWADGVDAGSMPELRGITVWFWVVYEANDHHGAEQAYEPMGNVVWLRSDEDPGKLSLDRPPLLSVRIGGKSGGWGSIRERAIAPLDDAIVAVDHVQARGRLSESTRAGAAMLGYFHETVRNAQAVSEAIRAGAPMPELADDFVRP